LNIEDVVNKHPDLAQINSNGSLVALGDYKGILGFLTFENAPSAPTTTSNCCTSSSKNCKVTLPLSNSVKDFLKLIEVNYVILLLKSLKKIRFNMAIRINL
jgi:hypothetical protein